MHLSFWPMEGRKMLSLAILATKSWGSNHVDDDDEAFVCLMYISSRVLVLVFIQYLFAEDNRCRTVRRIFIDRKVNQSSLSLSLFLSLSLARARRRLPLHKVKTPNKQRQEDEAKWRGRRRRRRRPSTPFTSVLVYRFFIRMKVKTLGK